MENDNINGNEVIQSNVNDDIFVTESNTFEVSIRYYKKGKDLVVESVDDEFVENSDTKTIKITFKYPSYSDSQSIHALSDIKMSSELSINNLITLQDSRIITLFRSWTLDGKIDKIKNMNTKIMKAVRSAIIMEIGMEGIL